MRVSKYVKSLVFTNLRHKRQERGGQRMVCPRKLNKNKTQTLIRYFWLLGMLARDFGGLASQTLPFT